LLVENSAAREKLLDEKVVEVVVGDEWKAE
jgi:hypothetical protein